MDAPGDAMALRRLLGPPPDDEAARVRRVAEVASRAVALAGRATSADEDAVIGEAAEWLALRIDDPARIVGEGVEHASRLARDGLVALGGRAVDAIFGQLSPARAADELVERIRLLEALTRPPADAARLAPALVPPLLTLLSVRREAPILEHLGTRIAALAAHLDDPAPARERLRDAARRALDGDRPDRRDAALAVLRSLGPAADGLADRIAHALGASAVAGYALGALSESEALPRIAEALSSGDAAVAFGGLRAAEVAATRDRVGTAAALGDACIRLLHDQRPRVGDQALLTLLVLGPPLRALTIWSTVAIEREAAWLFSLPFRAGELGPDLVQALYALAVEPDVPRAMRVKVRALLYALAQQPGPAQDPARGYWDRIKAGG